VTVILLGPQRRPTVDAAARSLGLAGPVATVTAGWQEREPDDAELGRLLGGRDAALSLYRRWLDVQERDPGYAAGERRLAGVLAELTELYLLRLDYAMQAVHAVQRRSGSAALSWAGSAAGPAAGSAAAAGAGSAAASAALAEAVEAVRDLDAAHLRRVDGARGEFYAGLAPHDRPVIAEHRAAVAAVLARASALVIAGGHVGVLAGLLHLFNVAAALPAGVPVIAWSAGAMAMADRIVLFHDRAPQGPGHPEVHGAGLSLVRGAVLLPHARSRLLLGDTGRMAVFARRFAPARCVPLEAGTRIAAGQDGALPPDVPVIGPDGRVAPVAA
jgi:hypothetical protein